jgi:DNA-binding transcriptional LysR family regulator
VPTTVTELERHHGIFYTNRGVADWRFQSVEGAVVVRGRVVLQVNNGDVMRDAAIAGLGLALLPSFLVADARRSGALRVVELEVEPESEFVYIAHPEGRRPSAKLRALAQCLRDAFGEPPYWDAS